MQLVSISSVMIRDVKAVSDTDSLHQACKIMNANKIGSVIVMGSNGKNGKVPVGIITERDLIRHIAQDIASIGSNVNKLMSRPLITIPLNASMKDALMIMISKNIRHIVILDENGALAGIVADKDIYRAIARDESLIAGLISDEMLLEHAERLEQQWVYKLGEILHRRIANGDSLERHKITDTD